MPERLQKYVKPEKYNLHLDVNFNDFTYNGKVTIILSVIEPVKTFWLHSEYMITHECTLNSDGPIPINYSHTDGKLHITSEDLLVKGTYELTLQFSASLTDDLSGFYRSRYIDSSGIEKFLATSHFEAPYARKAFPCFDEPLFKAKFSVSLTIPDSMTGISNMPVKKETVNGDRKTILFATTPPMSTYLLYCGAGHFDYIEKKQGNRTLRVYGINGNSAKGIFALQFAAECLTFFEQYSGLDYPLPKLDLIAIPDFSAGAMENWGAVTFREVLLLVDEKNTSLTIKKRVAEVVAHELWHQWSGNLVTMKWWDDLWLNESFATYIAFKAVDSFYPEWYIWDDFIEHDIIGALSMDMLSSTHPIAVEVHTANEIEEIFDNISYGKGAGVLRMIEQYIGKAAFRKGVSVYLKKFAFANAEAADLWNTLEQYSGEPVKDILVSWITKPGFPLVIAEKHESTMEIKQQRFHGDKREQWPIPLTWISKGTEYRKLLLENHDKIDINGKRLKLNTNQNGLYRVLYSPKVYDDFSDPAYLMQLSEYDRWGILNDLRACVFAGYAPLSRLLTLLDTFTQEKNYFVLKEIVSFCDEIGRALLLERKGEALFKRYAPLFQNHYSRLGINPAKEDSPRERNLRGLVIQFCIRANDESVITETFTRAHAYLNGVDINPDIRLACLSSISHRGTRELFEKLRHTYENKKGVEEKLALLQTLGEFTDPSCIIEFLDYALTDAVRRQDLRYIFKGVTNNTSYGELFFKWVQENWNTLSQFKKSPAVYMGLLQALIGSTVNRNALSQVKNFLDTNSTGFEQTLAVAYEHANMKFAFRERERKVEF